MAQKFLHLSCNGGTKQTYSGDYIEAQRSGLVIVYTRLVPGGRGAAGPGRGAPPRGQGMKHTPVWEPRECPNCGHRLGMNGHYAPPCLGDEGFWLCAQLCEECKKGKADAGGP